MPADGPAEKDPGMRPRSFLFVPGDRPERFDKAAASGADAMILDLEDSVLPAQKPRARTHVAAWLGRRPPLPCFVRVNPLSSADIADDLAAVLPGCPNGLVLPKAEGAPSIAALIARCGPGPAPPILPIATETATAVFELGTYRSVAEHLAGLTWGAEDLPAATGATSSREPNGAFTPPYEMIRALALFAAHAADVAAIETVFPGIYDMGALAAYVARARRDGFTGMMAIHPNQVATINAGFSPTANEIAFAREVVDAFATNPTAGALSLAGRMVDRPHLVQAKRILANLPPTPAPSS